MNSKMKLALGVIAFVLVIGASLMLYKNLTADYQPQMDLPSSSAPAEGGSEPAEPELTAAPNFTLEDRDGNTIEFKDLVGKPIVLNFWASWCGPCRREMPDFQKVWEELGDEVTFIMLNATDGKRETRESARAFFEEQGFTMPLYLDTLQEGVSTYGIYGFPTTIFINRDGYLITAATSMIDEATLRKGISFILEEETEEPASSQETKPMSYSRALPVSGGYESDGHNEHCWNEDGTHREGGCWDEGSRHSAYCWNEDGNHREGGCWDENSRHSEHCWNEDGTHREGGCWDENSRHSEHCWNEDGTHREGGCWDEDSRRGGRCHDGNGSDRPDRMSRRHGSSRGRGSSLPII